MEYGLVVLWLFAFLALGLVALPIATWLFRDLDAAAFAVPVALAVLTVVGHLVGTVAMGLPALLAGLAVLLGGSWRVLGRVDLDLRPRRLAEPAVVFAAGFLLVVAFRSTDPSAAPLPLSAGEKLLDYGMLRSLQRAPALPPEDMWFAGKAVQYHYGGHLTTTLLAALTATKARFAYNLALAGFFATLVTTAYGLAGSIATRYAVSRRLAGVLGAYFVGLAANLETAARVTVWLLPDGLASGLVSAAGLDASVANWSPAQFSFWDASRVLPVDPTARDPYRAATEFPLFAWLNGDLHAHMMSQSFVLLLAGLALVYWRLADDPGRRATILLGVFPPVAGLVGFVNLWSFPTVGGLVFLTVALAPGDPAEPLRRRFDDPPVLRPREHWLVEEARRVVVGLGAAAAVLALGVIWTLPFWVQVVAGGPGRSVEYWAPWSPMGGLLLVHGAFVVAFAVYLGARTRVVSDTPRLDVVLALTALVGAVALGAAGLGLFVPLALGAWWFLRTDDGLGFEALLLVAGAGLAFLVELLTIPGERFNVIFKPYVEVWLFWSIAAAVALARLSGGLADWRPDVDVDRWRGIGGPLLAVLVVLTGLYPVMALPANVTQTDAVTEETGRTLDATAYVETEYAREAPAIRWLDEREGQPTIVNAVPAGYWWRYSQNDGASAPSSLTGLPAVLGWYHEEQYRGEEPYDRRLGHVREIYTGSTERQTAVLERYDVRYVYVGPIERGKYDGITIADHPAVTVEREWEHVTIYSVEQAAL